jgi:hypothetical protein
MEAGKS